MEAQPLLPIKAMPTTTSSSTDSSSTDAQSIPRTFVRSVSQGTFQGTFHSTILLCSILVTLVLTSYIVTFIAHNHSNRLILASNRRPGFVSAGIILNIYGQPRIVSPTFPQTIAIANYTRDAGGSGWNYFDVHVNPSATNSADDYISAMRVVGYLEGALTCAEIKDFYLNYYSSTFEGISPSKETIAFLTDNYAWMLAQSDRQYRNSEYWLTVKGVLSQLQGLLDGMIQGCPNNGKHIIDSDYLLNMDSPTLLHLLLLNANGDLFTINARYASPFTVQKDKRQRKDHCSVLIKVLADLSDVVFGHSTWDDYRNMAPRTIKRYSLPLFKNPSIDPTLITQHFSSYPGYLSSIDDFFLIHRSNRLIDVRLAIMETSISIYNQDLLHRIERLSVISWVRTRVANQLSSTGQEWAENFSLYRSGTYANQWMIIDLNRFTPGKQPITGFLTILEEIPGSIHIQDVSDIVRNSGYWASYNQPFFTDISLLSGNSAECDMDEHYCYSTNPRANIFRTRQSSVHDITDLKHILSYNQFQSDLLSEGDPCNAIACRGDLGDKLERKPYGNTDSKVASAKQFHEFGTVFEARLGPTHDDQLPFCWGDLEKKGRTFTHVGQPECFNFNWQQFPVYQVE